jgi:signal transduction histidine kinase
MLPKSIRWRLPLSYASIALVAALALGVVLITTLRGYYGMIEHEKMVDNAQFISDIVGRMYAQASPQDTINSQVNGLSFVSQVRIKLYDPKNNLITDTGNPFDKQFIALNYPGAPPGASALFAFSNISMTVPAKDMQGGDTAIQTAPLEAAPSENGPKGVWVITTAQPDETGRSGSASGGEYSGQLVQRVEGNPDVIWRFQTPEPDAIVAGVGGATAGQIVTRPAEADQFAVSLASSPFGVGLRREVSSTVHSAESVEVPIYDDKAGMVGLVEVSNGPAYGTEIIEGMTWVLVGAGAVAVLIAAAVGWFISRTMTAPLLLLTAATAQMANGELSTRADFKRNDEFGVLAHSFDEMAQRVEATVMALRRFVADAAHQIHTPLTAVHADLELAASEPDDSRRQMFIERALFQLKRLEALTNDLLDLSRLEAHVVDERRTMVDLVQLVSEISEAFASRAEQVGIAFNLETSQPSIVAQINEFQFRHAIGNLLDNAIKFTPENGTITVAVRRDGDQVELCVNDTGIGISAEDLPQIFSRFHRGRNAAAYPGSGLGLAIIKAIIDGHHGQIRVESTAGNGTHFALRVPAGAS